MREELHPLGIDLYLHQQGIDTTTPARKALFQMMGVFAEFERAMIKERVKSGLERAKAQGKVLGRPTIEAEKEAAIRADLVAGKAGGCRRAYRFDAPRGGVRRRRPRHGVATRPARPDGISHGRFRRARSGGSGPRLRDALGWWPLPRSGAFEGRTGGLDGRDR